MECKKLEFLCYICGLYTPKTPKNTQRDITAKLKEKYAEKFKMSIEVSAYTPKIVCARCYTAVLESRVERIRHLPSTPMMWSKPNAEHTNCYACLCSSFLGKKLTDRHKIEYPEYPQTASRRPVWESDRDRSPHPFTSSQDDPQPTTSTGGQQPMNLTFASSFSSLAPQSSGEFYSPSTADSKKSQEVKKMSQADFNDHCRDLNLTVSASELEGSRLAERNFLQKGVCTTAYRKNSDIFASKFACTDLKLQIKKPKTGEDSEIVNEEYDPEEERKEEETVTYKLVYIKDLDGLFDLFQAEHRPSEWRLFLDGSSNSLKAVLLHNGNTLPSVPIAYCKKVPEKYESMEMILNLINYAKYQWDVICDYKLINILFGLMGAASKNPCAFCLWDAKYKGSDKYTKMDWPTRPKWSENTARKNNAVKPPLIPAEKILFPPLHIKIGLVTQLFKKIFNRNEPGIPNKAKEALKELFPSLSLAKLSAGVYNGPQIRQIFGSKNLRTHLRPDENRALTALEKVCTKFLGNERAPDYKHLINEMMASYQDLCINITIKMHTLICHLDLFKESCGAFSDEQGERFHQDLKTNEEDYAGKDMTKGLGRYCWKLIRETESEKHKRQASYNKKTKYFYVN